VETEVSGVDDTSAHDSVNGRGSPEASLHLGHVGVVASETVTQVIHSHSRSSRVRLRNSRLHADSVSNLELLDGRSNFANNSSTFVSEDHWFVDQEMADLSMGVVVDIRSTDSDSLQVNSNITRPHLLREVNVSKS